MSDPPHGPSLAESNDPLEDRVTRLEAQLTELRRNLRSTAGNEAESRAADADDSHGPRAPSAFAEQPPPKPSPSPQSSGSSSIERWFEERGFDVELTEEEPVDQVFDRIAEYLGDNFTDLERLLRGLLRSQRDGRSAHLTPQSDGERRHCRELCRILHDLALLSNFYFNRSNENLGFRANGNQAFQQFLEGYWLERYVLGKAKRQIEKQTSDFSVARNLELKGPTGKFEMDVFLLVEGEPIWIECKSRKYQQHIQRYVERAGTLGIPLDRTMLVVQSFETKDGESLAKDLRLMYGLSVTPTSHFPAHLDKMLGGLPGGAADEGDELAPKLAKCLEEGQMSPHPEAREAVLSALAELPAEKLPASVREIRDWVKGQVSDELEPVVHPVLMAVRRGGGMVGSNGRPYTAMRLDAEIAELTAHDVETLEALCRVAYEEALRRKLPALVDLPEFAASFERLVNGRDADSVA